jgi:hypothetical protein
MHQMGYCDCGREIHFPRTARFGDRLRCFNCRRILTLLPDGAGGVKPSYAVPSRRRAPRRPKPQVVIVQVPAQHALPAPGYQNPFMEPRATMPALPAPRRRGGLLAWLFGE